MQLALEASLRLWGTMGKFVETCCMLPDANNRAKIDWALQGTGCDGRSYLLMDN